MLHGAIIFLVIMVIAAALVGGLLAEITWFFGSLTRSHRRCPEWPPLHGAAAMSVVRRTGQKIRSQVLAHVKREA